MNIALFFYNLVCSDIKSYLIKLTILLSKYAKTSQFCEERLLFIGFTRSKISEESRSENISLHSEL